MPASRLVLRDLSVFRGDSDRPTPVIETLCLTLDPGARLMLVGPNGAGKTSLLLALVGAAPFTGEVEIAGQPLNKATLSRVREGIGFVFANPSEQLFCETVAAEVAFGLEQRGLDPAEVSRRVALALGDVGLTQRLRDSPQRLSLGEQRRVAAAAALALLPGLLLFDEPTASLDPLARASVLRSLKQSSSTLVLASHDIEAATELDAEVILINRGQLIGRGAARDVQQNDTLMQRAGLKSSAP